jgi:hypothetical protein
VKKVRVSDHFKLRRSQPYLDFVDVRLDTDIEVFVDPTALRTLSSPWGHECASLVQHYFEAVLARIKAGQHDQARALVSVLSERNEFHLGFSAGKSQGHGFGVESAQWVWDALSKSLASRSGLLKDLEDTCLLIEGIGRDMVSDAVCNIIRGPLIKYTQDMCEFYGIPITPNVASGPVWNSQTEIWESHFVPLPVTKQGHLVLVPKLLVRHQLSYEYQEYYRHYLLPVMQQAEISANTALVRLLKDGTPRVTKKALMAKYGSDKLAVVKQTLKYPHVLKKYKDHKDSDHAPPLAHEQLADVADSEPPHWDELIAKLRALASGNDNATAYEDLIERILSALFYPSLCHPSKQHKIHDGRKRIDITYANEAQGGFFAWLAQHYPAAFIFVECKNYGREIGNPEVDQLSGRFSPSRGTVGLLVCRSIEDATLLGNRCRDTANDQRGFILALDDDDLIALMTEAKKGVESHGFPLLIRKFRRLVE